MTPTTQAQYAKLPEVEGYIESCHRTYGKKVLLSIGGAANALSFPDASEATELATESVNFSDHQSNWIWSFGLLEMSLLMVSMSVSGRPC